MKRLSSLLTGIAMAILFLASCIPAEIVAEEVKQGIAQEIANNPDLDFSDISVSSSGISDIQVTDVSLVHKEGKQYTGFVTFKIRYWGRYEQVKYPIDVIYDGFNYLWEIHLNEKQQPWL